MGAIVGRVEDDRVIGDSERVEFFQHLADVLVMGDHHVVVLALAVAFAPMLFGAVSAKVHAGGVVPEKERRAGLVRLVDEFEGAFRHFVVDGFHALLRERPGILDFLSALAVRPALQDAARPEQLLELRAPLTR